MSTPACSVKGGVVFDALGRNTAERVTLPDGFYYKYGYTLRSLDGREISSSKNEGIFCLAEGSTLSTLEGQVLDYGDIDIVPFSRYRIFNANYEYFYVVEIGEKIDYVSVVAKWWERFTFDSPWKMVRGSTKLIDARMKWLDELKSPVVKAMLMAGTHISMRRPGEINELVGKKLHRQLSFIKNKLNIQLAPIGGRITKIVPFWDRGVALCHVWFVVNEKDPTRGIGCQVYKDGNFFFGPWCERISQDSVDGASSQLYLFPPKYTLRSWIVGPLYATAVKYRNENSGMPALFHPTGVKIYAPGTKSSMESDVPGLMTRDEYESKLRETNRRAENDLKKERFETLKKVFDSAPIIHTQGLPIFKRAIRGIGIATGVREVYVRSEGGAEWQYAVKFGGGGIFYDSKGSIRDRDGNYNIMEPHICIVPFSKGLWGLKESYYQYYYHHQIPMVECDCENCTNIRKKVSLSLKELEDMANEPKPFPF